MDKNIEMQVLGANGEYETIYPVPAKHASSHATGGSDAITPADIGAAPAYSYGTKDLTAGSSALETGKLYFVYE